MRKYIPTRFITLFLIIVVALHSCQGADAQYLPANYPYNTQVNFVRIWNATAPEKDPNVLMTRPLKDVKEVTQYLDGLGRSIQTVAKQGSLASGTVAQDIVSPVIYDEFSREKYKYLPFASAATDGAFKLDPFQQQQSFMYAQYGSQGETYYYGQTNFEPSPLNRPVKSFAPGNSWVNSMGSANERGVGQANLFNNPGNAVKLFTISTANGVLPAYNTNYQPGVLIKIVRTDEHNKQVVEFKDKEGNLILKKVQIANTVANDHTGWLCTYYVYDDFNRLRFVLSPKATEAFLNGQSITAIADELCFKYEYDQQGRMIMKKVPGAGEVWMVYDARDRLVMMQDANMRAQQKWQYTTYDELNRTVSMGLIIDPVNYNNLTAHLNGAYNSTSYPNINSYTYEELTRNFFNDYSWLSQYGNPLSGAYNTAFNTHFQIASNVQWPYAQGNTASANLKGTVTGSRVKVLGTSTYLYMVSFYDEKGRVIQVQTTNITGGVDVITTQYTWAGLPLVLVQKQDKQGMNAQTTVVVTQMTYDDLNRLIKIEKKQSNSLVNDNAMPVYKIIVQNEYDYSGRLKKKTLGSNNLETLTYDYNIRGWILGANREYAKDVHNNNYFGFDLGYDKANNGIVGNQAYNNPQYNGNIEGITWKSKGDGEKRKYDFVYDASNRILKAEFTQYTGGSFNQTAGENFDMKMGDDGNDPLTAYDANGNIKRMQQWGLKINLSSQIDNLSYEYATNSNKLFKVTDTYSDPSTKLGDFKDAGNTGNDYSYDVNGNMVIDLNKNILSPGIVPAPGITYNHLNLPVNIVVDAKGSIEYVYDAAGNKLKKIVHENSKPDKTTLYIDGMVYENDVLQFAGHEEGRIRFKPASGNISASLQYDYLLKDHLGNIRIVLTEEQQQDVYPAATFEDATYNGGTAISVEGNYYTIDNTKIVSKSVAANITNYQNNNGSPPYNNNPYSNTTANSDKLYRLNAGANATAADKMGLGITLKVMAGDRLDVFGKSYYNQNTSGTSGNNALPIIDLLTAFLNAPAAGAATAVHGIITPAQINTSGGITGINSMISQQNNQNNANPNKPRAFINVIFFDEQFKAVDFRISMVGTNSVVKHDHYNDLQNLTAVKSGFVYIYCSNESPVDVFFDNLQVVHTRSAILEETHYYPFGLTMAGISSQAAGSLENRYKFNNGTEFNNDLDLDLSFYETQCRLYDPQIGRFWQVDEIAEANWEWTPYNFGLNNPISLNDPLGLIDEKPDPTKPKPPPQETSTKDKPKDLGGVEIRAYSHNQMQSLYRTLRSRGIGMDRVNNDFLRARLQRWDGIARFMEKVHNQQKKEEMAVLEVASFFIPMGWITKLKYVKTAVNFFKVKRGVGALNKARKAMTTVLGKMGRYEKVAGEMEYNSFQLAERFSEKEIANLTEKEVWSLNMKFLDEAVAAGDEIVLSQRINNLDQVTKGSGLWKELKHLIDAHGFHFSSDGTKMIR